MVNVEQAQKIILNNILPLEQIEILEIASSLGRICALNIKAKENIPPFNNSAMDGFAIKSRDSFGASKINPKILEVIEDVPAGSVAERVVGSKQAIRIMTGAPMPRGADSVVMVEDTILDHRLKARKKEFIKILKEVKPGENVRYAGEDVRKGEVVINKGSLIRPQELGMLASLGISEVKVYKKPRIGILVTGDELVGLGKRLSFGKIRDSNTWTLAGAVTLCGAEPVYLGIARDKKEVIKEKIEKGLKENIDILLVSAGISVGDYDVVKDVLKELNFKMEFWKVAMRPGKPLAFGMIKRKRQTLPVQPRRSNAVLVFGLPGNPVSSMVCFEEFVRPAILKMSGRKRLFRPEFFARLGEEVRKKKGLRYFLRVSLENKDGQLIAKTTGPQGSGILKSMVLADGIMVLPEEKEKFKKGERVRVKFLDLCEI